VVCINALTVFYTYGRGRDLHLTFEWIRNLLLHRAYLEGTRYYRKPEAFLFFLTRLLKCSDDAELHEQMDELVKERVQELVGGDGDALTLAMRLLACEYVGLPNDVDLRKLLPLQCEDGSFETGWMYRFGTTGIKIGNRGLTTAMSINAIEAINALKASRPSSPQFQAPLHEKSDSEIKPLQVPLVPHQLMTEGILLSKSTIQPHSAPPIESKTGPILITESRPESPSRRFLRRASIAISTPTIERNLSPTRKTEDEPSSARKKRNRRSSMRLSFQWLQKII
jgi:hypothetical protein